MITSPLFFPILILKLWAPSETLFEYSFLPSDFPQALEGGGENLWKTIGSSFVGLLSGCSLDSLKVGSSAGCVDSKKSLPSDSDLWLPCHSRCTDSGDGLSGTGKSYSVLIKSAQL